MNAAALKSSWPALLDRIAQAATVGSLLVITSSISNIGYLQSPFGYREVLATGCLSAAAVLVQGNLSTLRFLAQDRLFAALSIWTMLILVRIQPLDIPLNPRFLTWVPVPFLYIALSRTANDRLKPVLVSLLILVPLIRWYLPQNKNEFAWTYFGYLTLTGLWYPRVQSALIIAFGLFAGIYLECRSALLAMSAALFYRRFSSVSVMAGGAALALALIALVDLGANEPFHFRDVLFRLAMESFRSSPLIGTGIGNYWEILEGPRAGFNYFHAHCFPATLLSDTGLVGAAVCLIFVWSVAAQWERFPLTSKLIILAFGVWSFFDEPLQWQSGWSVMILALTRTREGEPKQ